MVVAHRRADERKDSIAEYIHTYRKQYGFAPSVREIAENEGTSLSNTHRLLRQMISDRELEAVAGRARTWRLLDPISF